MRNLILFLAILGFAPAAFGATAGSWVLCDGGDAVRNNTLTPGVSACWEAAANTDESPILKTAACENLDVYNYGDKNGDATVSTVAFRMENCPSNTAVVGQSPTTGWTKFDEMVDEILAIDPNLEVFEVVRRGADGTIEALGVTPTEIAKFATKGEVPVTVEQGLAPGSASSRLFGGRSLSTVGRE